MNMFSFRIGGVPEHFNIPWQSLLEDEELKRHNIHLSWKNFKGGSGAMAQALRENELDMAVMLTEAVVTEVNLHNSSVMLCTYTDSPLIWGVHTGINNPLQETSSDIYHAQIAISRKGSGSHLMPILDAFQVGITLEELHFVEVKNIDGAISSLESLESDIFYWEKYTTLPYVQKGLLRRIGESHTPWPAFTIAVRRELAQTQLPLLELIIQQLRSCAQIFKTSTEMSLQQVGAEFNLYGIDAENWLQHTQWSHANQMDKTLYEMVSFALVKAGVLHSVREYHEICTPI